MTNATLIRGLATMLTSAAVSVLIACGDPATTGTGSSGPSGTPISSGSTTPAPVGSTVGISECDEYIAKSQTCVAKAADAERTKRQEALDATRTTWLETARTPEGRANLTTTCRSALAGFNAAPPCTP
jgi:hypothetical protein